MRDNFKDVKYVPIVEKTAEENGIKFEAIHIKTKDEAQEAPTPITTYALFFNGKYITNEQMTNIPLKVANIWGFRGKTIKKLRIGKYLYFYDDTLPESLLFALILL